MSLCYDFQKWTILSLALVAISLTVSLIILVGNANGQPADTSNSYPYFEYSNYNLDDMTIRYPQDWVYNEYGGSIFSTDDYTTVFVPSSEVSFLSNLTAVLPDAYVQIGKQRDLPFKNMPLDLYFDYTKKLKISQGFNITSTGKTSLTDGTPAYEIQAATSNSTEKMVSVIMNKNSESYFFVYSAPPDKFSTYQSIAQQMFKTLSFK